MEKNQRVDDLLQKMELNLFDDMTHFINEEN